jgi:uncharacterized alpha-E superfamily protein
MLSRVADNLYWTSRYLERAEHTARVIEVNLNLNLERSSAAIPQRWQEVLVGLRSPLAETGLAEVYAITKALSFDLKHHASIVAYVEAARENARQVREQISSEMWEQINQLYLKVKQRTIDDIWDGEPAVFYRSVREGSHLFQGITDSTMTHGEGWRFIQIGRYQERADATAHWLDVKFAALPRQVASAEDFLEWVGLLKSLTAFEAYCKVYTADIRPERVAEFLLLNRDFPRSVAFCVERVQHALLAISELTDTPKTSKVNRLAGKLKAAVDFTNIEEIMSSGVQPFLRNLQQQVAQIHSSLYQAYITYPIESALL